MKNCPYCNTLLEDNAQFCNNCNAPLGMSQFPQQNPNYSTYNNQQYPYPQTPNYGAPTQPYQPTNIGNANYPQQQFYYGSQVPNTSQMPYNGIYPQQTVVPENTATTKKKKEKKGGCCLPWFVFLIVMAIGLFIGGIVIIISMDNNNVTKKIGEVTTNQISQVVNTTDVISDIIQNSSSETASDNVKTVYYVGDILQDGDMKIVYIASGDYKEDNQFLQPKDGNKYIFLRLAFINIGKKDQSISFYSFNAYADGYACEMHYNTDDSLSAALSSGRSTIGEIAFEVPSNANDIEIEYSPSFFSSKKVTFVFEGNKDSGYVLEPNTSRTEGAYNVGDVITSKDLKITYLSSDSFISDNMFIQPKNGYHYVYTELEFENIGSSDKSISSLIGFNCYADGKACDKTFVRDDNITGTIAAGRKIKGTISCEVPDNAEIIELEYEDNIWNSEKIVFTIK